MEQDCDVAAVNAADSNSERTHLNKSGFDAIACRFERGIGKIGSSRDGIESEGFEGRFTLPIQLTHLE